MIQTLKTEKKKDKGMIQTPWRCVYKCISCIVNLSIKILNLI